MWHRTILGGTSPRRHGAYLSGARPDLLVAIRWHEAAHGGTRPILWWHKANLGGTRPRNDLLNTQTYVRVLELIHSTERKIAAL